MALQIKASEINFWKSNFNSVEKLKLRHELKTYPPRMKMTVVTQPSEHLILPVQFEGCSDDCRLNLDLIFPLGTP